MLVCTELADIAATRTGPLFERRLNQLKNLRELWANGIETAVVPIAGIQTEFGNDTCIVGTNKEKYGQ